MGVSSRPGDKPAPAKGEQPSEFTAVAPDFSGKVTNRPTPTGDAIDEFGTAAEQERQSDA
jgi:hypothetical protein